MKFNGDKFQVLRYEENKNIKNDTLYFTSNIEDVIEEVDNCRDLGIIVENTDKLNFHIDKACKQISPKCGWILSIFYSRNPKFLRHMYNTLVQPHIDFSSQMWATAQGSCDGLDRTAPAQLHSKDTSSERLTILREAQDSEN